MVYLSLQHHNFCDIQMTANIQDDREVELESTFSFKVSYNADDSACIAEIKQIIRDKNKPSDFSITVECRGHFVCEGIVSGETKKEAHLMAYTLLFPYVQNMITHLVIEAGMPPLVIGMAKLDSNDVEIFSNK